MTQRFSAMEGQNLTSLAISKATGRISCVGLLWLTWEIRTTNRVSVVTKLNGNY